MAIEYTEYQLQDQVNDATKAILDMEKQHAATRSQIQCLKVMPVTGQTASQIQILQDRRDGLEKQIPALVIIRDNLVKQLP